MTPIERAARALWTISGRPSKAQDAEPAMSPPDEIADWERFIPQARIVAEAIAEASVGMVEAGNHAMRDAWRIRGIEAPAEAGDAAVDACWHGMIDALLEEGP